MSLFEQLNQNSVRTIRQGIDLSTLEFKPIKEFIGQDILVDGFFFTEGRFGKQVVIVGNGAKINLPSRYVKTFELVQDTPNLLQGVLDGRMVLKNVKATNTRNGSTTTFDFATAVYHH